MCRNRYRILVLLVWVVTALCLAPKAAVWAADEQPDWGENKNSIDSQWVVISAEDDSLLEDLEGEAEAVSDPLEPFNRAVFTFNDRFYFWVFKPVATGYVKITPNFLREGVRNFFYNIMYPARFVGSIFQGRFERSLQETCRFVVNSTVGLAGLMTPSKQYEWLNPPKEDMGQAFARWGIGNGPYIVWPFIGASTLRDTAGFLADQFLYPFVYVDPSWVYFPVKTYQYLNEWSFNIDAYPELKKASMDPYSAVKDAYIQFRNKQVNE